MAKCDRCGEDEAMPYRCRLCGGTYCSEHRLPENHDCPGLDSWGDPDGVFDSGFDDSVADEGGRASGITDRIGLNTGTGSVMGYFRGNVTFLLLGLMWIAFLAELVVLGTLGEAAFFDLFVLQATHIERVWTWFTSIFAHAPGNFTHILFNSIVLYFFGPPVEKRTGSKKFLALFLATGAVAGLAQVGTALALGQGSAVLGASGAIAAVMGVLTVLNPNLRIYIWFILPMPLWIATALFAGFAVISSTFGGIGAGGVAQLAHLSGLALGVAYGFHLKRQGERAPKQLQFGGGRGGMGGGGRGRI